MSSVNGISNGGLVIDGDSGAQINNGMNGIGKKNNPLEPNFIEPESKIANGDSHGQTIPPPKRGFFNRKKSDDKEEEKKADEAPPISFFKLFKYSTLNDRLLIALGIVCGIITGLATPANTLLFGRLADAMIIIGAQLAQEGPVEGDPLGDFWEQIKIFAIWNSVVGAVMLIFSYLGIMLFNYAALSQIFTIRSKFLKSTLNQDIGWYDVTQSGEFASRMNEDLSKLEDGIGEKAVMYVHYISAFFSCLIMALVLGWQLALVCLASLPVTLVAVGTVAIITGKLAKQEMEAYAKAGTIAEEVFSAIRTVFAFSGQEIESERYKINLVEAKKLNIKKGFFSGLGFGILWFCIYGAYALSFWYGVKLVIDERDLPEDEIHYTPGTMFTVFFSVMMASMNLGVSSPLIEVFGIAKGAGAKVFSVIERQPAIDTLADVGKQPSNILGNITFSNVHFQYPSRKDVKVLQGLNLTIERGQTVALVGSSGCGKSTCIQLIQRFYDPISGSVSLDGNDIRSLNVKWLRSKIGTVGQEPVLFGTTIYENIRYGKEDATREEIENAAKSANAHNFIKKLPHGYDTLVGERGAQMSGGQKQRIAIARALVRNPEVLLLDEATSALDTASEAKVQAALEKASEGRTTVIVAHRLSTIRNADRIFVFKNGVIVEFGTHHELMKARGVYSDLVITQLGHYNEEEDEVIETKNKVMDIVDEDDMDMSETLIPIDEVDALAGKAISVWEVMKWNKPEKVYIALGSIASIIMGGAMPLFSLVFGEIMGVLTLEDPDEVRSQANMYSLYFVIIGIVVGIATFIQIYTYGIAGERLTERVRGKTFDTILRQEIGWFDDKTNGTGTLCAKLSGDAAAVQGATGQRIGTVLQSIATIALAIGIAFGYEWRLAFVALAFTPFILVASYFEIVFMEQQSMGNAKALEQSTKLAVEVVSNIRTVVSLGKERMFLEKYLDFLTPSLAKSKRNTHLRGCVYGIARSLMFFSFSACMAYGGHLIIYQDVSIANVFIVTQALIMGSLSIANALAFAPNFQKGLIAAGKINRLFQRKPKIQDPVPVNESLDNWKAYGGVTYYKTEFFYPSRPSTLVLKGLTLSIMQGQTVALVGPSGCGKSTCIQLLERFYDSTDGYVAVDNKEVTSITLKNLRSQLGIVSQEPSLFDRSIADNIAYGDNTRKMTMDEIIEAAKKANIHNFISTLPLGYETRLGDKGTQLSGGQKQRVAIARALVRNPRILLLDEATSALDSESEKVVQEALDAAKEGRTCITIAHRLTTIVDADVICVIDAGQITEKGTHQELMELNGMYKQLFTLQSGSH